MKQSNVIQWFPGHMAKARRLVQKNLALVDVVIELLDARIPLSSRNPMIDEILGKKPRLVVLNKADLADEAITKAWLETFTTSHSLSVAVDSISGKGFAVVSQLAQKLFADKKDKLSTAGRRPRAVRCMVVGIPNVGKSSFINRLSRRKSTKTADTPGVTKGKQWIKIDNNFEILDTPGILWPKFQDSDVGLKLAATGAIKEQIIDIEEVALYLLKVMQEISPHGVKDRYNLEQLPDDVVELLNQIGIKRGLLIKGGLVDTHKAAVLVLKEFRAGKMGLVSLEKPD